MALYNLAYFLNRQSFSGLIRASQLQLCLSAPNPQSVSNTASLSFGFGENGAEKKLIACKGISHDLEDYASFIRATCWQHLYHPIPKSYLSYGTSILVASLIIMLLFVIISLRREDNVAGEDLCYSRFSHV